MTEGLEVFEWGGHNQKTNVSFQTRMIIAQNNFCTQRTWPKVQLARINF